MQLPVGSGELFTGHIDVIERKQYIFDEETLGKTFEVVDVPDDVHARRWRQARHDVIEAAVEHDDELIEKYLSGDELTHRRDPARDPRRRRSADSSCRCCAARRSRTRACRRCSMR